MAAFDAPSARSLERHQSVVMQREIAKNVFYSPYYTLHMLYKLATLHCILISHALSIGISHAPLLQVMLENDDALKIVKTDLANLVASARRDGVGNAEVKDNSCQHVHKT